MTALLDLLRLAGPERRSLILSLVLRLAEGLLLMVPLSMAVWIAAALLDPAHVPPLPELPGLPGLPPAVVAAGILGTAALLQLAVAGAAGKTGTLTGYAMTARLRRDCLLRLRSRPPAAADGGGPDPASVLMTDIARLEVFPGILLPKMVQGILFPLAAIAGAMVADPVLGLPLLVAALLLGPALLLAARLQRQAGERLSDAGADLNSRLIEMLHGMPVLKSFALTTRHLHRAHQAMEQMRDAGKALTARYVVAAICVPVLVAGAGSATIGMATHRLMAGDLSTGPFLLFLFLTLRLFSPVIELVEFSSLLQQMSISARRLSGLLETTATTGPAPTGTLPAPDSPPEVTFRAVSLTHTDGTAALRQVSFTAPAGGLTALVGHTGAGKTTVALLAAGHLSPTGGQILLDGQDLSALPPGALPHRVGMMPQHVTLFSLSVSDNIRLGRPSASQEEIETAARRARCHDLILSLPQGYDTVLSNGGAALSGGERQRLALARLFLQDCPVMILDEATSALDVENERLVQDALSDLAQGRTLIVIAHRLWTVRHADRIVVLDQGRVDSCGTHAGLLATSPVYSGLWSALSAAPGWHRPPA